MIDGGLFDKLAEIGSLIRGKPEPFGGIQVRIGLYTCYPSD
jgi:ATP-dependent DNA helicase PIF1